MNSATSPLFIVPLGSGSPQGILRELAMDWKLFASTFAAIFLAEIGDKTQLATLSLAAGGSSRMMVFAGSALALILTSAIAVLAGGLVAQVIPPIWLKRAAGVMFLVLGIMFVLARPDAPEAGAGGDRSATDAGASGDAR